MVFIIPYIHHILMKKQHALSSESYIKPFGFSAKHSSKGTSFYLGFDLCEIFIFVFSLEEVQEEITDIRVVSKTQGDGEFSRL